jgi:predicted O-methyltransferase YrrM
MSPLQRVRLLESLMAGDLYDEVAVPEIVIAVTQALQVAKESLGPIDSQEVYSDDCAGKETWNHLHVLTWCSKRFRPVSYLEIGSNVGATMAMVALSSPQTHLVSCVSGQEPHSLNPPHFRLARFLRELARSGSSQPLTLVRGDGLGHGRRYLTDWALRSRGRGQLHIKGFDLIFVDGSCRPGDVYRDLKNAFGRCALGGMVVFRGTNRPPASLPGQYCPRLSGYWERLPLRFPGFRYLKAPPGREIGLACRVA